jgi:uncharacterized protein involved in exopolysaccharide biosynthesis
VEPSTEFDIGKYARLVYTKRVFFVLTVMAVTTTLVIAAYLRPKVYEARSVILIERSFINDLVKNVSISPALEDRTSALSIVMKSRSFVMRVLGDLDLGAARSAEGFEGQVRSFQNSTDIRFEMNSSNRKDVDVFTVSFIGYDPKLASDYVNALVRRYIEENISMKQQETSGASRFLLEQVNLFKEKLDRAEAEIVRHRQDRGVVPQERLAHLQKKLSDLQTQYTENHPEVIKVKAEIEQLIAETKLKKGSPERSPAAGMAASGDGERDEQGQNIDGSLPERDVPAGKKGLADLERERDANKRIYEELLGALGKTEFSTQVEVRNKAGAFKIVEPAIVPTRPMNRNILKMIVLGILGGVAAGFGLIIGLDLLDTSLRSVETVKKLGLPVLAIIPTIQTVQEAARSRIKDRLLYTTVGVYLTGLMAVVMIEMMGLPYVDNIVQGTRAEIKSSLQRIW